MRNMEMGAMVTILALFLGHWCGSHLLIYGLIAISFNIMNSANIFIYLHDFNLDLWITLDLQ